MMAGYNGHVVGYGYRKHGKRSQGVWEGYFGGALVLDESRIWQAAMIRFTASRAACCSSEHCNIL